MRLTFLGTGPSKQIPRPSCKSPACRDARRPGSRSKRTRSSLLLNYLGKNILIDASLDFLQQVKKNQIRSLEAVLITHPHLDAYGGIKQLNNWLKKPINLYCQKQTWLIIKHRFPNLPKLQFKEIKPYKEFEIDNLKIFPILIHHSVINEKKFPTLAYKIGDLIYCSDVKEIPTKSQSYFKNINTLILDSAMYFNKQIFSHLNTSDSILLGEKLHAKKLYLTQIGHSYPPFKIAEKEIIAFVKKNQIKSKVHLAYDNLKINA